MFCSQIRIMQGIELQVKKVREDNNIDFYEKQIKFQDDMIKRKDGDLTSRQAGTIGGNMVKKMIADYENRLAGK